MIEIFNEYMDESEVIDHFYANITDSVFDPEAVLLVIQYFECETLVVNQILNVGLEFRSSVEAHLEFLYGDVSYSYLAVVSAECPGCRVTYIPERRTATFEAITLTEIQYSLISKVEYLPLVSLMAVYVSQMLHEQQTRMKVFARTTITTSTTAEENMALFMEMDELRQLQPTLERPMRDVFLQMYEANASEQEIDELNTILTDERISLTDFYRAKEDPEHALKRFLVAFILGDLLSLGPDAVYDFEAGESAFREEQLLLGNTQETFQQSFDRYVDTAVSTIEEAAAKKTKRTFIQQTAQTGIPWLLETPIARSFFLDAVEVVKDHYDNEIVERFLVAASGGKLKPLVQDAWEYLIERSYITEDVTKVVTGTASVRRVQSQTVVSYTQQGFKEVPKPVRRLVQVKAIAEKKIGVTFTAKVPIKDSYPEVLPTQSDYGAATLDDISPQKKTIIKTKPPKVRVYAYQIEAAGYSKPFTHGKIKNRFDDHDGGEASDLLKKRIGEAQSLLGRKYEVINRELREQAEKAQEIIAREFDAGNYEEVKELLKKFNSPPRMLDSNGKLIRAKVIDRLDAGTTKTHSVSLRKAERAGPAKAKNLIKQKKKYERLVKEIDYSLKRPVSKHLPRVKEVFKSVQVKIPTDASYCKYVDDIVYESVPNIVKTIKTARQEVVTIVNKKILLKVGSRRITTRVTKVLKFLRKASLWAPDPLDVIDLALFIRDAVSNYRKAKENPVGCRYRERDLAYKRDTWDRIIKHTRVVLLGDSTRLTASYQCDEKSSLPLHNDGGNMGIRDHRFQVPECSSGTAYNDLDERFSDRDRGVNIDCLNDSDCSDVSTEGRCVFGKCNFPVMYVGMQSCEDKRKAVNASVTPVQKAELLTTRYQFQDAKRKFAHQDPISVAAKLAKACNETMFFEYNYDEDGLGSDVVSCFDNCNEWVENNVYTKETWTLKMLTVTGGRGAACTTSDDCGEGQLCTSDGQCAEPIEFYEHSDCFGYWKQDERLPCCDPTRQYCVDTVEQGPCTDIRTCSDRCEYFYPMFLTPEPTSSDFNVQPTPFPTLFPSQSPITPSSPNTTSPSVSPTFSPVADFTNPARETLCAEGVENSVRTYTLRETVVAEDQVAFQDFGRSVKVLGEIMFVGSPGRDAVYFFVKNNTAERFEQRQVIFPRFAQDGSRFGAHVDYNGEVLVVSASLHDSDVSALNRNDGSVFGFKQNRFGIWEQVFEIVSPQTIAGFNFGTSLSLSNTEPAVGAAGTDALRVGGVYIYLIEGDAFTMEQFVVSPVPSQSKFFASSVLLTDATLFVGARGSTGIRGSVFIFKKPNSNWVFKQELDALDQTEADQFGYSMDAFEDSFVVGAPEAFVPDCGDGNIRSGAVYYFETSGTSYGFVAKLFPHARENGDRFGSALLLSNSTHFTSVRKEGTSTLDP